MEILESDHRILLRLERGEDVLELLTTFMHERQIPHAVVMGIGAIEKVELGAYDLESREYRRRRFEGAYELVNLNGNIGWADGMPMPHVHVVLSDARCQTFGGHLFAAKVYATLELVLWPGTVPLERVMDEEIGLKLWKLPHKIEPSPF